jgi:hypothetical protein
MRCNNRFDFGDDAPRGVTQAITPGAANRAVAVSGLRAVRTLSRQGMSSGAVVAKRPILRIGRVHIGIASNAVANACSETPVLRLGSRNGMSRGVAALRRASLQSTGWPPSRLEAMSTVCLERVRSWAGPVWRDVGIASQA